MQLQRKESENTEMKREIEALRRQFEQLGKDVPRVKLSPKGVGANKPATERQESKGDDLDRNKTGSLSAADAALPAGHS